MGDFMKAFMPSGTATKESGEDLYYRDVDQKKLNAGRMSSPSGISVSRPDKYPEDMPVLVNNSKGGAGNLFFPSTSLVRQSLRPIAEAAESVGNAIDPYTGFSEAFMSNQPTPLPSSQRSVSPISQARDSSQEDNTTEYMGRPLSDDDDDNSPRVGQIL